MILGRESQIAAREAVDSMANWTEWAQNDSWGEDQPKGGGPPGPGPSGRAGVPPLPPPRSSGTLPPPPRSSGTLPPPPRSSGTLPPPPSASAPTPSTLPPPKAGGAPGASWPAWGEEEEDVRKPLPKSTSSGARPAAGRPGGPPSATPNWPSWSDDEDEPARPAARGKNGSGFGGDEDKKASPFRSAGAGSTSAMPAWADQGEQQEGWLGGGAAPAAAAPKGGLPPVASHPPAEETETTSGAAVWESDGLMGSATIPVDDSDILPSMREPEANSRKMLLLAIGLLLAVICGLGFILTRPPHKVNTPDATDVLQPSSLMEKARASAAKKNYKGAALDAESAVAILQTKPESKKDLIKAQEFLASMYLKTNEFERAYKIYKELNNSTGDKKYAGLAREAEKSRLKAIRGDAAAKLKAAKAYLAKGDPGSAIMEGLHAEQLYNDGKGSNAQKAAVCYTIGRAFERQGADDRAEEYYKKAVNLDANGEYYAALSSVRARTAPVVVNDSNPEPQVIEVDNSGVPTGNRNVVRRPRAPRNNNVTAPPPPPPPPPRQQTSAPIRRTPKSTGLPSYGSDKDPSRLRTY